MNPSVGFVFSRAVEVGNFIVTAVVGGPTPKSISVLSDENSEITLTSYIKEKRPSYWRNGVPVRPCNKQEHEKIVSYLVAEGFNELLCNEFTGTWTALRDSNRFENCHQIIFDENNCDLIFDEQEKELYSPLMQETGENDESSFF